MSRSTDTYRLRWPRALFVSEASALVVDRPRRRWDEACELLLSEAFDGGLNSGPVGDFRRIPALTGGWGGAAAASIATMTNQLTPRQQFLNALISGGDQLHEGTPGRRPYWRERTGPPSPPRPIRFEVVVKQFVAIVDDLNVRGYFEMEFDKDCVDAPSQVDPAAVIEESSGLVHAWPVRVAGITSRDILFTLIEILHDLAARPRSRYWHDFSQCGWHHEDFSVEAGQAVYRWQVNQLLDRSELGYRLAESGEDAGWLVASTDDARAELVERMVVRVGETGDQVRHAIALFRARGADKHRSDPRSSPSPTSWKSVESSFRRG